MQFTLLLLLLLIAATTELSASNCDEACQETEYGSYVNCLRKRIKRSADCANSIQESCTNCDCNFCVVNTCPENCGKCCENQPSCGSKQCCHRKCHSRCKSSTCRTDCRKHCVQMLIDDGFNITIPDKPKHNITTVIQLHNTINNTNVIDIPIQVNTTNVNNFTVNAEEDEQPAVKENCCHIISPRQCTKLNHYPYAKCVHYRKKACGSFCVTPILHEQIREICVENATGETCREQKVYIPQPQPMCSYQPTWPFVLCRGNIQQQFCGGCYQQSSHPFPPSNCPYSCYDDGYGQGPYYRQGPFYRPGYSHVPSCYQTGTCPPNWNYGYGYPSNGYRGMQYPPTSYPNSSHILYRPHPNFATLREIDVQYPPPSYNYPIPIFPPYISTGYQYPPPPPIYVLPPEVDIQAVITHPAKTTTYAQITINKSQEEEEKTVRKDELSPSIE